MIRYCSSQLKKIPLREYLKNNKIIIKIAKIVYSWLTNTFFKQEAKKTYEKLLKNITMGFL